MKNILILISTTIGVILLAWFVIFMLMCYIKIVAFFLIVVICLAIFLIMGGSLANSFGWLKKGKMKDFFDDVNDIGL